MTLKILIVDDSSTARKAVKNAFKWFDCQLFEANDGHIALTMTHEVQPGLIILDYNMPRLDGLEFVRELRRDSALDVVKVLMLTAAVHSDMVVAMARAGVNEYLPKPFHADNLIAKASRLVTLTTGTSTEGS
jgi:two-component system cell cycle response regulator